MPHKGLFVPQSNQVKADAVNEAGGVAYSFSDKHALCQFIFTGTFGSTFYTADEDHLKKFLELCDKVQDNTFLAKLAVAGRVNGYMKDTPAAILAVLAARHENDLVAKAWPFVIDNMRMFRGFLQILLSRVTGRRSMGTAIKKLCRTHIENMTALNIWKNSVGQDPSIKDVIRLCHPRGKLDDIKNNMYAYLLGKPYNFEILPAETKAYELFKKGQGQIEEVGNVPFQMLDSLQLDTAGWTHIAKTCTWQTLRMNINTLLRHGVFEDPEMVKFVSSKLRDENEIRRAKVFPYQLYTSWKYTEAAPMEIQNALQDAMDISLSNVPVIGGQTFIGLDVSGSMNSPVTGKQGKRQESKVMCVEAAAIFASAFARVNPNTSIIPFEQQIVDVRINPRDSVVTNAQKLAAVGGGGTNCALVLNHHNNSKAKGDLLIMISDYESWMHIDTPRPRTWWRAADADTQMMAEWDRFKVRNPKAKLVCIDLVPQGTSQSYNRNDILNIGGFSDKVFDVVDGFCSGNPNQWIDLVNQVEL